jgi:hypothetical protein
MAGSAAVFYEDHDGNLNAVDPTAFNDEVNACLRQILQSKTDVAMFARLHEILASSTSARYSTALILAISARWSAFLIWHCETWALPAQLERFNKFALLTRAMDVTPPVGLAGEIA